MKNAVYILIILACVGTIAFGLLRGNKPQADIKDISAGHDQGSGSAVKTAASSAPVAIGQVAQHFRPDTAAPADASDGTIVSAADTAERNFQITSELLAKMYLIDTYKPGTCFGAPSAPPQIAIDNLVADNPPLSNFLKQKYRLETDLEIYNKRMELQGITLKEIASSKYNFTFIDGQCQNVTYYEGTVTVSGSSVSAEISKQESHTYQ
ncbi:MAG: hypothetical protein WCT26_03665 [Candidatus Buchananbacteria bacterium]|jgi:hypothetical protein